MRGRVRAGQRRLIHPENPRVRVVLTEIKSQTFVEFPRTTGQYSKREMAQWREFIPAVLASMRGEE